MTYKLVYSKTSRDQIRNLHPQIKAVINSRLQKLKANPFTGKSLARELSGYRSLRAQRFRVIYCIREKDKMVEIHHVGRRTDIYELFKESLTQE
ncbi:MAG: type II toxin-antitoxin system RelE/ParE family toxin [Deltaproteobacteria bacterium]|nr:type II toxin-antitoxin system RelE/ParE family toxin [Deltaproteobacteria bacterium]